MYPQHLIDLAEEAFDVYLSKSPEAKEAWDKLVAAVTVYLADIGSTQTVNKYVDDLSAYLMER